MMQKKTTYRQDVLSYVREKYGTAPDYPWMSTPDAAVLRHKDNKKWYGLIMRVKRSVLGLDGDDETDVINVKCQPLAGDILISEGRALPAYHMNKKLWMTILLDGSQDMDFICKMIDESYELTK